MGKNNIQVSVVSTRSALIIFGAAILLTGINYFYSVKQIAPLLPGFIPGKSFCIYFIGTALALAGIAIIINKQITTPASFLLAILLSGLLVAIDLRGILNNEDQIKFLFTEALLKDIGLVAGTIIIANFEREKPSNKHKKHRHRSSSKEKQSTAPVE